METLLCRPETYLSIPESFSPSILERLIDNLEDQYIEYWRMHKAQESLAPKIKKKTPRS